MKRFFYSLFLIFSLIIVAVPTDVWAISTWFETQPAGNVNRQWVAGASDADGTNLIVADSFNRRFFVSTSSGTTWTEIPDSNFPSTGSVQSSSYVASDADGSNLIISAFTGRLFTSDDGGANWTERQPMGPPAYEPAWRVASDDDGSFLMAGIGAELYLSDDGGVTWSTVVIPGAFPGVAVASDADGSNLVTAEYSGNLYTSSDSGENWVERSLTSSGVWSIDSDSDGSNLIAANTVRLYTSSNGGANWTERQPAGDVNKTWSVASDDDGSNLIVSDGTTVYVSTDGGVNWEPQAEPPGGTVFSDADGSNLGVYKSGGRIYLYGPDVQPPTVASLNPTDNATEVGVDATFEIVFNEDVATSTGNITLKKSSDDTTVETIDVAGPKVMATSTDGLVIDPATTLELGTGYYFLIDAGAVEDLSGNAFAGISATSTWNFTTDTAPTATDFSPPDDATDVSITILTLTFSESVVTATGTVVLKKSSDDSVIKNFDVTNEGDVAIEGDTAYFYVPDLEYDTEYYMLIATGAFEDEKGNAFAGITDETTWSFTTGAEPNVLDFERVSVSSAGDEGDNTSSAPKISSDGRYVLFGSSASTLTEDVIAGSNGLFLHDRQTGETVLIADPGADAQIYGYDISGDGRYVVYGIYAFSPEAAHVYLYDREMDTTTYITEVTEADGSPYSYYPSISSDGSTVAFVSSATNLVGDDTNDVSDIFVFDVGTETFERVSVSSAGGEGDGGVDSSYSPAISEDGRYVAFGSYASNLVADDTNDTEDAFVYDRTTDTIERVSVSSEGDEGDDESYNPVLSADGRYVAFASYATTLIAEGTESGGVFLHDRQTGETTLVVVGDGFYSEASNPDISGDGRFVAYAFYVYDPDTDGEYLRVYRYDTEEDGLVYVTDDVENDYSDHPALSTDGSVIAFDSYGTNLVIDDTNDSGDVFVYEWPSEEDGGDEGDEEEERGGGGGSTSYHRHASAFNSKDAQIAAIMQQLIKLLTELITLLQQQGR